MILILVAVLVLTLVYLKIIKPYSYWTDKGVKQRKQTYLLGDNAGVIFKKESFWDLSISLYNAFPGERYMGTYQLTQPILVVNDPDLIKQMCVKDFDHFVNHIPFVPEDTDKFFAKNLFSLNGDSWRDMRSTLSPSFTSSKMKFIFNLISECAVDFTKHFLETSGEIQTVELKEIFTRHTNDVIASTAFGIKCDSLKDPKNEFYVMGKDITTFAGVWNTLKFLIISSAPQVAKILRLSLFKKAQRDFFERIVKEAIKSREKLGIVRPDMLQLLVEARNGRLKQEHKNNLIDTGFATVQESPLISAKKIVKQQITDLDIAAQAMIFFFGGFESVSTAMCHLGHELVENLEVQRKLQEEIERTLQECEGGTLTYEALLKMKYMDMVVSELLRKWPISINSDRICTKPYTIQPTKPTEKPVHLKEGDKIFLPINGIHHDPRYYPNPERFDPERFNDENKYNINQYTYLPFGLGPRNCIGSRFALLEIKAIFFHLLSKFDFVEVEKTQIPLKLTKSSFNLLAENGFWIGLKPRNTVK